MSMPGHVLLVSWLSGLLFLGAVHWPADTADLLGLVESLLSKFLFCMSFGLWRGLFLKKVFSAIEDQDAQFQCRLFLLVQALIFGAHVGSLELL